MSESHNEQKTGLTYPNETVNTIQLVVYDSDREQTTKPNIWSITMSSRPVQERTGFRPPLHQILHHRSFDHLRTVDKVFDQITYLSSISGILVKPAEKWQLAKLWILLKRRSIPLLSSKKPEENLTGIVLNYLKYSWTLPNLNGSNRSYQETV